MSAKPGRRTQTWTLRQCAQIVLLAGTLTSLVPVGVISAHQGNILQLVQLRAARVIRAQYLSWLYASHVTLESMLKETPRQYALIVQLDPTRRLSRDIFCIG